MTTGIIEIRPQVRPIYYQNKKALFHKWSTENRIVEPSVLRGGHGGGVVSMTIAIIETEDGKIHEVAPTDIWFADPYYFDRIWNEQETRKAEDKGDDA